MRIAYLTTVRLPSERAHGHQIAQVCDALVQLGHEVTIIAPFRRNTVVEDYWTYYGADWLVQLERVGAFDPIDHPLFPRMFQLPILHFLLKWQLRARFTGGSFDLLYTRNPALLSLLTRLPMPTILELHQLPRYGRRRFVHFCNRCHLVVCLTSPMRDVLKEWGVKEERLTVEGDAVDLARFAHMPSMMKARVALECTTERTVVGYVGRLKTLGMEKGVLHLLQALALLKASGRFFGLIVGGPEEDRRAYEEVARDLGLENDNVRFVGSVPQTDVSVALAACDILAMPFPDVPHYRTNMSPLKMFEYMAVGKPILTSDLPTIRDVLSGETAFFCTPGDSASIADMLQFIDDHPEEAQTKAEAAQRLVQTHTWEHRMQRVLQAARVGA